MTKIFENSFFEQVCQEEMHEWDGERHQFPALITGEKGFEGEDLANTK